MCQYVLDDQEAFCVEDVRDRFGDEHPFVKHYNIETYYGTPVQVRGTKVGALCVLDFVPRDLTDAQKHALVEMAEAAAVRLEARLRMIELTNRIAVVRVRANEAEIVDELVKIRDVFSKLATELDRVGFSEGNLTTPEDLFKQTIHLEPLRRELVWAFDRVSEVLTEVWALSTKMGNAELRDEAASLNSRAGEAESIFRLFLACLDAKISSLEFYRNMALLSIIPAEVRSVHHRFDRLVESLVRRAA